MKSRIFLIGDINGSYRTQNLVKYLMDRGYLVGLATRQFYINHHQGGPLLYRVIRKVSNIFLSFLFIGEVLVKALRADILYLLPMNCIYTPLAFSVKRIFQKPLITELYISAYDTGRDRSKFDNNSLKARSYRLFDRILIEKSDIMIHLSRVELEYIAHLVGASINPENIKILPLAVEPREIAFPVPSKTFRVCWWGTFIPLHGLEKIINAAKILIDRSIDVRFDLFGVPDYAQSVNVYKHMITNLSMETHLMIHTDKTFANGKLEPHLQAHCDLALGNFGDSEKAHRVIVNKIIDAFAMRLPVLTMDSPALSEFIDKDQDVFVCFNTPEKIADAIKMIMNLPEERNDRACAGYQCYQRTFTIQNYTSGVQEILEMIEGFPDSSTP